MEGNLNLKIFKKRETYKLIADKLARIGDHELVLDLFKHKISHDRRDLTDVEWRVTMESFVEFEEKISKRIRKVKGFREKSTNEEEVEFLNDYLKNLEGEYMRMCCTFADLLTILETFAQAQSTKVSYLTLTAGVYVGASKIESISYKKRNLSAMAVKFFEKAKVIADKGLSPVHSQRLSLMVNYVRFRGTLVGGIREGSRLAEEALNLAGEELKRRGGNVSNSIQGLLNELEKLLEKLTEKI